MIVLCLFYCGHQSLTASLHGHGRVHTPLGALAVPWTTRGKAGHQWAMMNPLFNHTTKERTIN